MGADQPLVAQLQLLSAKGRELLNGPRAYRSSAFVHWKRDAEAVYDRLQRAGVSPVFVTRFQSRRFGRTNELLTDSQIFARFKQDMISTLAEFQSIIERYHRNDSTAPMQASRADRGQRAQPLFRLSYLVPWVAVGALLLLTFFAMNAAFF